MITPLFVELVLRHRCIGVVFSMAICDRQNGKSPGTPILFWKRKTLSFLLFFGARLNQAECALMLTAGHSSTSTCAAGTADRWVYFR